MKLTIGNLDKTYKFCMSAGNIKEKSVDLELDSKEMQSITEDNY